MSTVFADHLLTGDHASRPAAAAVPAGTLYSCTTHGLVYQSDGSSAWNTWATLGALDHGALTGLTDDDHTQYQKESEKSAANGYASLDANGVVPDGELPAKVIEVKVFDDATALATGDGKAIFCVPAALNGYNLTAAHAFVTTVSSSGAVTVQIRNVTQAADMLSTAITIDQSETTSYTAATPPVVDAGNDDVATGDLVAVDVDGAGTGAKGLGVILTFTLP